MAWVAKGSVYEGGTGRGVDEATGEFIASGGNAANARNTMPTEEQLTDLQLTLMECAPVDFEPPEDGDWRQCIAVCLLRCAAALLLLLLLLLLWMQAAAACCCCCC